MYIYICAYVHKQNLSSLPAVPKQHFLDHKAKNESRFWKWLKTIIGTLPFSFVMSVVMLFCSSRCLWGVCWLRKDYSVWDKVFLTLGIYPLTYILYFCFLICTLFLLFMARKRIKEIAGSVNFQLWQSLEASSNKIITLRRASSVCLAQQPDSTYRLVLKGALLGRNCCHRAEFIWARSAGVDAMGLSAICLLDSTGFL